MVYNSLLYIHCSFAKNAKLTLLAAIATCDAASKGGKYFQSQHSQPRHVDVEQFSILVYAYNVYLVNVLHTYTYTLYTMPRTPTLRPPPLPRRGGERGGSPHHIPSPPNTSLDDVNHRLAWLKTHSLVLKIIKNQYNTPKPRCITT